MTIILGATRPAQVALAADRLWHDPATGETGEHSKVRVHPHLPLVLATGGFSMVKSDQIVDLVLERTLTLTPTDLQQGSKDASALLESLGPFIDPVGEAARAAPTGHANKAKLTVYIGWVLGESQTLWVFHIDACGVTGDTRFWNLSGVDTIGDFYARGNYADLGAVVMRDVGPTVEDLGRHLRSIVQAGIDEEMRLHGRHVECGGPVDVALVDRNGSRLLERPCP